MDRIHEGWMNRVALLETPERQKIVWDAVTTTKGGTS